MQASGQARALALITAAALGASGCGGTSSQPGTTSAAAPTVPTTTGTTTAAPASELVLRVYLLRDGSLRAVRRTVRHTQAVARAALEQLLAGPTGDEHDAGLTTDVPGGAQLLGVSVADGTATVDLSDSFGDADARRAQVVYTLTQFPTVSRVAFRIADGPAGPPTERADYEMLTPPLLVETPLPGERVTSPLHIAGTANAFEATFQAEIVDAAGKVLAHKTVMATSGSGQRGTFAETLPYTGSGAGKLVVYEDSAADGSRIHQVAIPLELRP